MRSRLASHASGKKSGDKFCLYVADEILEAAGHSTKDEAVRNYVCKRLSYRFFAFEGVTASDLKIARAIERRIQAGIRHWESRC